LIDTPYFGQAALLLRILPLIQKKEVFALKGGTALNFFIRDLPRLSVDIDLTYIPINDRDTALREISDNLYELSKEIEKVIQGSNADLIKMDKEKIYKRIVVRYPDSTIKIEPNFILRGTVYTPEVLPLCQKAQEIFQLEMDIRTLSKEDLYAGKLCAALDRQHPRDLFDVHILLQNEGITEATKKAFIVYLISHSRPMAELLNPRVQGIEAIYEKEFQGMTNIDVEYDDLCKVQKELAPLIVNTLNTEEKQFIVSVKQGKPQWDILGLQDIERLPAVRWKLYNISQMNKDKHQTALNKLRNLLNA